MALIEWCDPEQAIGIGLAARQLARFDAAETAFGKAAAAHVPGAEIELADEIGASGHPARAVQLLADALIGRQPDDPETLRMRSALARYTQDIDQPEVAARMFAQLLDDCRRVLGPDHPDTLMVRRRSTIQIASAGNKARTQELFDDLLADHIRLFGPDHLDTLRTRHLRAIWIGRAGDPATALTLFTKLLTDRIRIQGPDHPNVLSTRFQIAVWTSNGGKPQQTVEQFGELLKTASGCSVHTTRTQSRPDTDWHSAPEMPVRSTQRTHS